MYTCHSLRPQTTCHHDPFNKVAITEAVCEIFNVLIFIITVCCPAGTYGRNCDLCPISEGEICGGHGDCQVCYFVHN